MGKKLLPCPVCSGESFIESVTQGGLICTDCGAVSNQVEVADDDDPLMAPKTFIRTMSYKKVTEEESQAKRDRRVVLKQEDRRNVTKVLQGMGLILEHMVENLISRSLCPALTRMTVREAWFEFLTLLARSSESPVILSRRYSRKLQTSLASWGIPSLDLQRSIVLKHVCPPERSKQHAALCVMLDERRIGHSEIRVIDDGPGLVFAHDWLYMFFNCFEFPFPDSILQNFTSFQEEDWAQKIIQYDEDTVDDNNTYLTGSQRRTKINQLFKQITNNDAIRNACKKSRTKRQSFPPIDLSLTLPLVMMGIRNAGGGVLATHVLNWIARCDLPYYSAHKILPSEIDKVEYYRISRSNHGYKPSIFCPRNNALPLAHSVRRMLAQLSNKLGLPLAPNNPVALTATCLNMLGIEALLPLAESILEKVLFSSVVVFPGEKPIFDKKVLKQSSLLDPMVNTREKIDQALLSDLSAADLAAVVVAFCMKLVFPQLHAIQQFEPHEQYAVEYTVQSDRERNGARDARVRTVGTLEWWDSLNGAEKQSVGNYFENELFNELRECVVEDIRSALTPLSAAPEDTPSLVPSLLLISGHVSHYQLADSVVRLDTPQAFVLRDVCAVAELRQKNDLEKLNRRLCQLETFFFAQNS